LWWYVDSVVVVVAIVVVFVFVVFVVVAAVVGGGDGCDVGKRGGDGGLVAEAIVLEMVVVVVGAMTKIKLYFTRQMYCILPGGVYLNF
jgi:hypothetical protein